MLRAVVWMVGGVLALAILPATAGAQFATLGVASKGQMVLGPVFAGSEVVWGQWSRLSPDASPPGFSLLAALPGSQRRTLFSAPALSAEEELQPAGLLTSATQVAFAYEVYPHCGPPSLACTPTEALSPIAFDGPPGGPFRRFTGPLDSVAGGLSGEEYSALRLVAGSYVASSTEQVGSATASKITVGTFAGTPLYSVSVPLAEGEQCWPGNGEGRCAYSLNAEGTLAIVVPAAGSYALYWASAAQPQLHRIAVTAASAVVAISGPEIVYVSPVGSKGAQLALTDLSGNTRPISFPLDTGGSGVSGLAFDGASVAWVDGCIYGGSVPVSAPPASPESACEVVSIRSVGATVAANGLLRITLSCKYSPCSGSLGLTTAVKKVTGSPGHEKTRWRTVRIASGQFTGLALASRDRVSLRLNASGLELLRRSAHGLGATLTATVSSGSSAQKTSRAVSLKASWPRQR